MFFRETQKNFVENNETILSGSQERKQHTTKWAKRYQNITPSRGKNVMKVCFSALNVIITRTTYVKEIEIHTSNEPQVPQSRPQLKETHQEKLIFQSIT